MKHSSFPMFSKRKADSTLPMPKRRALQPVCTQLATPPTSPKKNAVVDISASIQGHGRKLVVEDSVYSRAKALFQRGARDTSLDYLVGRKTEADAFTTFIKESILQKKCSSLYISGAPGTGKTAQVNLSLDFLCNFDKESKIHCIHGSRAMVMRVNCMTISKPENIFNEIYNYVSGTLSGRRKTFDDLYAYLTQTHPEFDSLVVVLDEMDCLITKDQQVLFQLFHCASHLKSSVLSTKLILVGISNALDLTDKFLPRLRSNGFNPESLQFLPYTSDQIRQVVMRKLTSLMDSEKENAVSTQIPIMHPAAIQLCCKKCAAVTGDLRKAFDICFKSIEYVEQHARQTQDISVLTLDSAPKVLISHVAKVCSATFGYDSLAKIRSLNLLQKAVLCCLFNLDKRNLSSKSLTVNQLYDYYCTHTAHVIDNLLGRLKKGEFLEIVGALEASSTVTLSSTNRSFTAHIDSGNKSIRPDVLYDDMLKCVEEVGVLKKILLST